MATTGLVLLWAVLVTAAVFVEARWFTAPPVVRGDFATIENHLVQELTKATERHKVGSAALMLIQGGKLAAEHGFGVADVRTRAPVDTERTLFQMASVSKAVTAWGVMELVEEGKLGLDEHVVRHLTRWRFPGSEAYRDRVTARHLLSHTAGLDDGLGYGGFLPGETVQSLEESLTLTKDSTVGEPRPVRVTREPGTAAAYSSGGYTVLQLLVEEVTGRPFADYMKEAVLQPLGMTRSSFDWDAIVAEGRAQDLAPNFDKDLKTGPHRRYTGTAGVALYATPRDMARLVGAFTGRNPVLSRGTLERMMEPQPGASGSWGLGLALFAPNAAGGHVVGYDGGSVPAWGAMMRVNPATGNGMVMMVSGGRGAVNQLGHDWVYWETGVITAAARREVALSRLVPATLAIVLGAVVIVLWTKRISS